MINYIIKAPSYKEYIELKNQFGWKTTNKENTIKALNNSIMCVCAYDDETFVGMGRLVGDDGMVYVISNIMINPNYHHQGIGTKIMETLMNYLDENCTENALVMLMARKETEAFYKRFGFFCRPSEKGGSGMCKYY